MSSACPKCGAEIDDVYNAATFFKCGTRCYKDGKKYTTKICRVRAEAIAEMGKWLDDCGDLVKCDATERMYDAMKVNFDRQWREVRQ